VISILNILKLFYGFARYRAPPQHVIKKVAMSGNQPKEAMDSSDNDEKRSAAHSVNLEGNEFSLAEECARLLWIGSVGRRMLNHKASTKR
jgi:hypothetical protein